MCMSVTSECRDSSARSTLFLLPLFIAPHAPIPIPFASQHYILQYSQRYPVRHPRMYVFVYILLTLLLLQPHIVGGAAPLLLLSCIYRRVLARTFIHAEHWLVYLPVVLVV